MSKPPLDRTEQNGATEHVLNLSLTTTRNDMIAYGAGIPGVDESGGVPVGESGIGWKN